MGKRFLSLRVKHGTPKLSRRERWQTGIHVDGGHMHFYDSYWAVWARDRCTDNQPPVSRQIDMQTSSLPSCDPIGPLFYVWGNIMTHWQFNIAHIQRWRIWQLFKSDIFGLKLLIAIFCYSILSVMMKWFDYLHSSCSYRLLPLKSKDGALSHQKDGVNFNYFRSSTWEQA